MSKVATKSDRATLTANLDELSKALAKVRTTINKLCNPNDDANALGYAIGTYGAQETTADLAGWFGQTVALKSAISSAERAIYGAEYLARAMANQADPRND